MITITKQQVAEFEQRLGKYERDNTPSAASELAVWCVLHRWHIQLGLQLLISEENDQ